VKEANLPYTIEPMEVRDIPEVMEVERLCFSLPWSSRAYRYEIEENSLSTYLVARPAQPGRPQRLWDRVKQTLPGVDVRGPILGYGGFWMMVDEAHISTLCVRPEYRRRGIGELLLLTMIELAEEKNATAVTLEVRISNSAAEALYEKYGFTVQGRRYRYYTDNGEDAYIMTTPRITTKGYQRRRAHSRVGANSGPEITPPHGRSRRPPALLFQSDGFCRIAPRVT
jgi:ribosomal-protein-alanine N-acetyltransferase